MAPPSPSQVDPERGIGCAPPWCAALEPSWKGLSKHSCFMQLHSPNQCQRVTASESTMPGQAGTFPICLHLEWDSLPKTRNPSARNPESTSQRNKTNWKTPCSLVEFRRTGNFFPRAFSPRKWMDLSGRKSKWASQGSSPRVSPWLEAIFAIMTRPWTPRGRQGHAEFFLVFPTYRLESVLNKCWLVE